MKYTLIIIASLILISCGPSTRVMSGSVEKAAFDFRKYTEQDFLITPEKYDGNYESIGMVTITLWPSVLDAPSWSSVDNDPRKYSLEDGTIMTDSYQKQWFVENLKTGEAIDQIYEMAKEMGADAIMSFDINSTYKTNGSLQVPGIEVTGFAIKRK